MKEAGKAVTPGEEAGRAVAKREREREAGGGVIVMEREGESERGA